MLERKYNNISLNGAAYRSMICGISAAGENINSSMAQCQPVTTYRLIFVSNNHRSWLYFIVSAISQWPCINDGV